jgi:Raf kinase inhibitor-like YbhB/YbcL family protein
MYILVTQKAFQKESLREENIGNGIKQGSNSWRKIGYGGHIPPWGTHWYVFKLYTLDRELDIDAGASKAKLIKKMEGHILEEAELSGKYKSNFDKKS